MEKLLINIKKLFNIYYWQYILEKPKNPHYCNWITRIKCRMNGHPKGVHWYNLSGNEPDMHCKTCYDDLG